MTGLEATGRAARNPVVSSGSFAVRGTILPAVEAPGKDIPRGY
ncbi:hypothetical protein [Desulfoscipio gibsoniae]|uniref:Uncharacterized protein n=1 Tax=Desulfoscipio gibsoniae DSM 7213 TaxID=767817 RepID=R4KJC0_9FIRM|nr:hypothetical protein [Desulfoscipio gibsoniae]AGL03308.1 hypothetical protein Desgi_4034 [Desulfoscipio gibsoniae DSM 7213]